MTFEAVSTIRNRPNDFRVSLDSQVKYINSFYNRHCPWRRRRSCLYSLILELSALNYANSFVKKLNKHFQTFLVIVSSSSFAISVVK